MSSLVCVDASLIIRALVPGPFSDKTLALLGKWKREGVSIIAPALMAFEVTSTLRRFVYHGVITAGEGETTFEEFLTLDIRLSQRQGIFPLAWDLAKQFNRPRAYDASYLAVAQLNDCQFWTADEKLYNAVRHQLDWVKWIGDYSTDGNGDAS